MKWFKLDMRGIKPMTDYEFSSWFTHDGGPCPLSVGTICIRESLKAVPNKSVRISGSNTLITDNVDSFITLSKLGHSSFETPNPWEWKYFKTKYPSGSLVCKTVRYRVKKSLAVKLLEQIAKDPPIDLIPDPERKLLEYHPT